MVSGEIPERGGRFGSLAQVDDTWLSLHETHRESAEKA